MHAAVRPLCLLRLCCVTASAADLDRDKLRTQIIKHEGKRCTVYLDSAKPPNPTIGVGFNLNRKDAKQKIEALGLDFNKVLAGRQSLTEEQVMKLLEPDIDRAIADCKAVFPGFADLSDVRQRVFVDMMFNLGKGRFEGFEKMIAAVKDADFARAADEMKDSEWYTQVKQRGIDLVDMMRNDRDRPEESVVGAWDSDWGPVALLGSDASFTGFWIQGENKKGVIEKGTFDPQTGKVRFSYYQDWNKQNGEAEFTLSKDGKMLSGSYKQTNGSGEWRMTRKPGCP